MWTVTDLTNSTLDFASINHFACFPYMNKSRLSHREIRLLVRLAEGDTYQEICNYFGISYQNVYSTCAVIRRKLGIRETRDAAECKRYLAQIDPQEVANALEPKRADLRRVTDSQLLVFRLLAAGRNYAQIAGTLGITSQSAQNLACRGAQRAGLHHHKWDRTTAIREWLAQYDGTPSAEKRKVDPMNDGAF